LFAFGLEGETKRTNLAADQIHSQTSAAWAWVSEMDHTKKLTDDMHCVARFPVPEVRPSSKSVRGDRFGAIGISDGTNLASYPWFVYSERLSRS
jgi:hypothetical protein